LKTWAKSLKICTKPLKIWVKSLKIWQKRRPTLFDFKNGAQRLQKNAIKTIFWRLNQKQGFMFFVGENVWTKGAQKLFGKVGKIRAKNLRTPQNMPAPTPM